MKYDVKSDNSSMSLGINNDQGLNRIWYISERSRDLYGWTHLIIFKIVRLFHKILFPDCDSRLVMLMNPNMD